jgi:hypothetical protein
MIPTKPEALPVIPENIPPALTDLDLWILWRYVWINDKQKWDKPPLNANGHEISITDTANWLTFAEALAVYQQGSFDGIGIVLTGNENITAVDLDKCLDDTWPHEFITGLDSYTELSPSGNGYHIFVTAKKPDGMGCKSKNFHESKVEVYDKGRYLTVTGQRVEGTPQDIQGRQKQIESIFAPLMPKPRQKPPTQPQRAIVTGSEDDIVQAMFKVCRNSESLFHGNGCEDASADDLALCNHLAFMTGSDAGPMDQLFRKSGLYRDKWDKKHRADGATYGQMTIEKAIEGTKNAFEWNRAPAVPDDFSEGSWIWPVIVSLDTAPPARLPIESWPEPLRSYALGAAAETETPPELPAMLALGVVAAAAQKLADVEVKPGYREPINIYTAVALPPAARKSAEFKRATKPLVQWEAKQREMFAAEIKQAESLQQTHRERVKAMRQQAAKAKDDDEAVTLAQRVAELEATEPELPKIPRVFTSDVTTEHLATMMENNGEALAVMSSEGGIFETMAGRYSNAVPNIDLYLQSHAADAVRVDRGSKPPAMLDNPRLTITLAVQPDVLDSLSNKPGFRGRGLLGRFLYVLPPSTLGNRTGNSGRMSPFAEMDLHSLVIELLEAAHKTELPGTLTLSPEAFNEWQKYWQVVESQLGGDGLFAHMTDWGGKLPGAVARIAALFHLSRLGIDGLTQPIQAADMITAIATGKALATHAHAVYGAMGADPAIEGAKVLIRWIKRHNHEQFTARDAQQDNKSRFPRAVDVDQPLTVLIERGYIAELLQAKGQPGRPSRVYMTNPVAL